MSSSYSSLTSASIPFRVKARGSFAWRARVAGAIARASATAFTNASANAAGGASRGSARTRLAHARSWA
jgi:hypothetical protein